MFDPKSEVRIFGSRENCRVQPASPKCRPQWAKWKHSLPPLAPKATLPETNRDSLGFLGFLRVSLVIYGMKPWDLWDETNKSPLKMDGWNTILSFWDDLFSGASC